MAIARRFVLTNASRAKNVIPLCRVQSKIALCLSDYNVVRKELFAELNCGARCLDVWWSDWCRRWGHERPAIELNHRRASPAFASPVRRNPLIGDNWDWLPCEHWTMRTVWTISTRACNAMSGVVARAMRISSSSECFSETSADKPQQKTSSKGKSYSSKVIRYR